MNHMNNLYRVTLVLLSIIVAGCAAKPTFNQYQPGGDSGVIRIIQPQRQLMRADTMMGYSQSASPVMYPAGNVTAAAGAAGLAGALILGSINRGRHRLFLEATEPLWEHMEDIHYDEILHSRLSQAELLSTWIQGGPIEIVNSPEQDSGIPNEAGASLLSIEPYPMISSNLRTLYTRVVLKYYERGSSHIEGSEARVRRHFLRYFDVLVPISDTEAGLSREENRDLWLALSEDEMKAMIEVSMDQIVRMIEFSLETPKPSKQAVWQHAEDIETGGRRVKTDGEFLWLHRDAHMTAVHRNAIKEG